MIEVVARSVVRSRSEWTTLRAITVIGRCSYRPKGAVS
ncbi:hypothetical protein FTUN_4704 [Frigoriglobus tundricola]|uniref:Uncharacterized protein n=1 Tax=Frigoriglobus tundricola TaxID=2774151 RepID=A0A6M5YTG1_9BACT|nr:hypothetical protein FTUN_4704 [Frigoriglobus tundricola]